MFVNPGPRSLRHAPAHTHVPPVNSTSTVRPGLSSDVHTNTPARYQPFNTIHRHRNPLHAVYAAGTHLALYPIFLAESSLSAVDMGKAEEQLRGVSALMLELQRGIAEVQLPQQTQPLPPRGPAAGAAPSTLPREDAYETRADMSVLHTGRGKGRHAAHWNVEPETLEAGHSGLAGGGRRAAGHNAGVEQWQGAEAVNVRMGAMGGAGGAGGIGASRQGEVVDGEHPVYRATGRPMETHIEENAHPGSTVPLQIEVIWGGGTSKNVGS